MGALSAVEFFSKAFTWFANISSQLPKIDFKTYFIVVVALLLGVGLIIALTFFGTYRFKLTRACRKIIRYLAGVEFIDDDNVSDFTAQCFSAKAPSVLRDSWVQYLGVRFGYPSDIVSEQNVYDKEVKRVREIRANVYIAIALILLAIFSFWGYGTLDGKDMGVIFLAGLLLSGVIYLVLVILNKMQSKTCLNTLSEMQEDLDAKVILQVEKSFATDSSPLADLSAIVDEIVARNTAKDIGFDNGDVETPIEMLIAQSAMMPEQETPKVADSVSEYDDDIMLESFDGLAIEEPAEEQPVVKEVPDKDNILALYGAIEEREEDKAIDGEIDGAVDGDTVEVNETEEEAVEVETEEPSEEVEEVEESEEKSESVEPEQKALTAPTEKSAEETEETAETENGEVDESEDKVEEPTDNAEEMNAEPVEQEGNADEPIDETEPQQEEPEAPVDETEATDDLTDVPQVDEQENADESADEKEAEAVSEINDGEAQTDSTEEKQNIEEAAGDSEPKVVYIEEPVEEEETVKPAKLVKLPNLIDYMLKIKPSRKLMLQIATLLLSAYSKFKDSAEDRKIVIGCMKNVMLALQSSM